MVIFSFLVCFTLMAIFAVYAILLRFIGEKGAYLLPNYFKVPKEIRDELDLDKILEVRSCKFVGCFFFFLIAGALISVSVAVFWIFVLIFFLWTLGEYFVDPVRLYKDYRKFKPIS